MTICLEAIGQVLGDAVTPAVAAAWSEAIMALAKLFIEQEAQLYDEAAQEQWTGPRDFVITDIVQETTDIKSFRMVPSDGQGTCPFQPGQYISIFEKPEGKQYFAPRHYTLTSQPGDDYYQVSIKKVATNAQHPGVMSNYMHSKQVGDTVQLGPVFGPVPMQQGSADRVACFVSVGVGITPTVAVLPTALKERPNAVVFHADASSETFAFRQTLEQTLAWDPAILNVSYSHPSKQCASSPYVTEGRSTGTKIVETLEKAQIDYRHGVDYYICAGNVASPLLNKQLLAAGVAKSCLHLEYFGPFVSVPEEDEREQQNGDTTESLSGAMNDKSSSLVCPFLTMQQNESLYQVNVANRAEHVPEHCGIER